MKFKAFMAALLAALSIGGVVAAMASATIGPFGGRYIQANAPTKNANVINFSNWIWGNGGGQTVNLRLMIKVGGVWQQRGSVITTTIPSGNYPAPGILVSPSGYTCTPGSHQYRTEAKWASYSWANADKSGAASYSC